MRTVLFDLDGTLTDPQVGITHSLCHALTEMGRVAPEPQSLCWCIGPPLQESIPLILGTDDEAECSRCLGLFRERFSTIGLLENTVYPSVADALESLRCEGVNLLVATSKPHIYAQRILEHFDLLLFFRAVYGSELDGTRTNKVDLLGHLLASEGMQGPDCVMVGDREHDILAARAHGCGSVGVLWGYGSAQELTDAGADVLCASPPDLAHCLLDRLSANA